MRKALPGGLREKNRFYNFSGNPESDLDFSLTKLDRLIGDLKKFHPELDFPRFNRNDIPGSVNFIHHHFAHTELVTKAATSESQPLWTELNILLHGIEQIIRSKKTRVETGLSDSLVIFTWNEPHQVPIPQESYRDFAFNMTFGTAYIGYAQIGRHFLEIFLNQDDFLADEHIQPARYISANTHLWFGPTTGHYRSAELYSRMQKWFEERKERFNSLGFFWDSPEIALGYIPVASLKQPLYSTSEIKDFMNEMTSCNTLLDVQIIGEP